jgi:hypothetical protein
MGGQGHGCAVSRGGGNGGGGGVNSSIKDFVRETLIQIVQGVDEARVKSDISIAPAYVEGELKTEGSQVHFEIAVTTSKEVDGGLKVLTIADLGANIRSESLNRVSFDVPVWFHGQKIK